MATAKTLIPTRPATEEELRLRSEEVRRGHSISSDEVIAKLRTLLKNRRRS